MSEIKLIHLKEVILSDNEDAAELLRAQLAREKVFMLNVMASPGAGKTSLILQTIHRLKDEFRIAVIEADIDSMVDSEKVAETGAKAIQLRTGGGCHLDAPMVQSAIDTLDLSQYDLLIIENVGNLVCPAEFDTGATKKAMILSVPEGDDKILKYPLMFTVSDALVINKCDTVSMFDFNFKNLRQRASVLNPDLEILEASCKTGDGLDGWIDWLRRQITAYRKSL